MAEYKNTELDDLNRRLGEALTSNGKVTLVHAKNSNEIQALDRLGFQQVGTFVDENNYLIVLYNVKLKEKEVVKIVEVPTYDNPWKQDYPFKTPYTFPNTGTPYTQTWCGSGDAEWLKNQTITTSKSTLVETLPGNTSTTENLLKVIAENTQPARNI